MNTTDVTLQTALKQCHEIGIDDPELELAKTIFESIVYHICAIILTIWAFEHCRRHWQDVYTQERKSVAHLKKIGRKMPNRDSKSYKLVQIFTTLQVVFAALHCWALVLNLYIPYIMQSARACRVTIGLQALISLPKLLVFYVLTLRLDIYYFGAGTNVAVNKDPNLYQVYGVPRKLLLWAIIGLSLYMLVMVVIFVSQAARNSDNKEPWRLINCVLESTDIHLVVCDVDVAIYFYVVWSFCDVGVNFIYVALFIYPLRSLISNIWKNDNLSLEKRRKLVRKIKKYGLKVLILSLVLSISTLSVSFIWGIFVINLFSIDDLINAICLMLMTPYYDGTKLYKYLCWPCRKCCDKSDLTLSKHELMGDTDTEKDVSLDRINSKSNDSRENGSDFGSGGTSKVSENKSSHRTATAIMYAVQQQYEQERSYLLVHGSPGDAQSGGDSGDGGDKSQNNAASVIGSRCGSDAKNHGETQMADMLQSSGDEENDNANLNNNLADIDDAQTDQKFQE